MDGYSRQSAVIYSPEKARCLTAQRLLHTYIGLRRVRPSCHDVTSALKQGLPSPTNAAACSAAVAVDGKRNQVVYKIVGADGVERRMTNAEKKVAKREAAKVKMELRKQNENSSKETSQSLESASHDRYVSLDIDSKMLEDELADIRGHRDGVPPVIISPPLARQAALQGLLPGYCTESLHVIFDWDLSKKWAAMLKASMAQAEYVRDLEEMRPMPYQLNPEVWMRMRPDFIFDLTPKQIEHDSDGAFWSFGGMQPVNTNMKRNDAADSIIQMLYKTSQLHVSCGAKFGCDFLLYNGPRDENHAFAGLRIEYCDRSDELPLPTAYDLSGFVRGLNTAAKLALLSTVVVDGGVHRVAVVDLALEKIFNGFNKRAGPDLEKLQKKRN